MAVAEMQEPEAQVKVTKNVEQPLVVVAAVVVVVAVVVVAVAVAQTVAVVRLLSYSSSTIADVPCISAYHYLEGTWQGVNSTKRNKVNTFN